MTSKTGTLDLKAIVLRPRAGDILRELRRRKMLSEAIPELAAMESNSRSHKDNVEHSIRVMENAKSLSEDPEDYLLFIAALFHDVGKPATLSFESGKATFRNHELVGARQARKFLKNYGLTKAEIEDVCVLIREHMRGHTFKEGWSDSAIRRLAREAGSIRQIERLGIIFASDATTKDIAKRNRFRANALELRDAMLAIVEEDKLKARRPAIDGNRVMELTGLTPGRELGKIMAYLNSEEGLGLTVPEAELAAKRMASES